MVAYDPRVIQPWSHGGRTAWKKLSVSSLQGAVTVNAGPLVDVLGRLSGAATMMMMAITSVEAAGDRKIGKVKSGVNSVVNDTDKHQVNAVVTTHRAPVQNVHHDIIVANH